MGGQEPLHYFRMDGWGTPKLHKEGRKHCEFVKTRQVLVLVLLTVTRNPLSKILYLSLLNYLIAEEFFYISFREGRDVDFIQWADNSWD